MRACPTLLIIGPLSLILALSGAGPARSDEASNPRLLRALGLQPLSNDGVETIRFIGPGRMVQFVQKGASRVDVLEIHFKRAGEGWRVLDRRPGAMSAADYFAVRDRALHEALNLSNAKEGSEFPPPLLCLDGPSTFIEYQSSSQIGLSLARSDNCTDDDPVRRAGTILFDAADRAVAAP